METGCLRKGEITILIVVAKLDVLLLRPSSLNGTQTRSLNFCNRQNSTVQPPDYS
jgi:hypothetical protein